MATIVTYSRWLDKGTHIFVDITTSRIEASAMDDKRYILTRLQPVVVEGDSVKETSPVFA
jgi:hypothetical protein